MLKLFPNFYYLKKIMNRRDNQYDWCHIHDIINNLLNYFYFIIIVIIIIISYFKVDSSVCNAYVVKFVIVAASLLSWMLIYLKSP